MRSLNSIGVTCTLFILSSLFVDANATVKVGNVAIAEGDFYAQKGQINYTRPHVGDEVGVNEFGQYQDIAPDPAFVRYQQNTRRHLKPNDTLSEGEVLQTMSNSWAKILFDDNSILDIGPTSVIQVQKFINENSNRNVLLKVLYGKFRHVITEPLSGPQKYQVITPNALLGVRGTEFIVNVELDENNVAQTDVVCLHGQVSIDVARYTTKGIVYHQPMVLIPGSSFTTRGVHGISESAKITPLPQNKIRELVGKLSPMVNMRGTLLGALPTPNKLPGTGLKLMEYADRTPRRSQQFQVSSFDSDHAPIGRAIASPSGNFEIPKDFSVDSGATGGLADTQKITGAPPMSQLPGGTSRVKIEIGGI